MHYYALVQIDPDSPETVENQIGTLMGPYIETYDEITEKFSGFWDWYSIGGRWDDYLTGENVALRRDVPEDKKPYTLITPEGAWEKETYVHTGNWKTSYFKPNPEFEDAWENLDLDATLVVVDYHC